MYMHMRDGTYTTIPCTACTMECGIHVLGILYDILSGVLCPQGDWPRVPNCYWDEGQINHTVQGMCRTQVVYYVKVAEFPPCWCVDHGIAEMLLSSCGWVWPSCYQFAIWLTERVQYYTLWISDRQCFSHTKLFTVMEVHCLCCTDYFWCCHWGDQRPEQGVCVWPLILVCGATRHTLRLPGTGDC